MSLLLLLLLLLLMLLLLLLLQAKNPFLYNLLIVLPAL